MSITNFIDPSGDFFNLYDSSYVSLNTTTYASHYISKTQNKDIGSIFTLYASISPGGAVGTTGAGYTGQKGDKSNYILGTTDIGTLLVKKNTIASLILPNLLVNGNFASPSIATNTSSQYATFLGTSFTINSWSLTSTVYGSPILYLCNGIYQGTSILPKYAYLNGNIQCIGIRSPGGSSSSTIGQSLTLATKTYTLDFDMCGFSPYYYCELTISWGGSTTIVSNLTTNTDSWNSYKYTFSATAGTNNFNIFVQIPITNNHFSTYYSYFFITGLRIS